MKKRNKVSPQETVTRYIFSKRHYAKERERVKYPAFLPKNGETSVFRIANLSDNQIWHIGEHDVAAISSRALHARGDIVASDVFDEDLEIKPDTRKHRLHANIVGWPLQEPHSMRLIATNLAEKAQLHLKP